MDEGACLGMANLQRSGCDLHARAWLGTSCEVNCTAEVANGISKMR